MVLQRFALSKSSAESPFFAFMCQLQHSEGPLERVEPVTDSLRDASKFARSQSKYQAPADVELKEQGQRHARETGNNDQMRLF